MTTPTDDTPDRFFHANLPSGVEFAADLLPQRNTVALTFRVLTGLADEPANLNGIAAIVERTLSKGTEQHDGQGLADAFDALGAQWASACGRQSTLVRVLCLPEFVGQVVTLVAEMLRRPTFPDDAVTVALELARQDLKQLEDEPDELLRVLIQRLTLGPVFGRHGGGTVESLARISPAGVREHWSRFFCAGRLQVSVAGPVDAESVARLVGAEFSGWGDARPAGRDEAGFAFTPGREHRHKQLEQQYIGITLPGLPRSHPEFAVEQVLIGVLAGGMSGRLFTEVREKQGLVYWVGAWHEQLRGRGVIHLGASTTPERCRKTYETLLRELTRLGEDLTGDETARARDQLLAHMQTEDDLTRARAANLSDDLFHFGRPIGGRPREEAIRAVTRDGIEAYVHRLPRETRCVATLGPLEL